MLEKGKCYKLVKVLVKQFEGIKYLSFCDGASVELLLDFLEIDLPEEDEDDEITVQATHPIIKAYGEIVSILSVTDYTSCMVCTGSVRHVSEVLARCIKCQATPKLSHCNSCKSAKILLSQESKKWYLTAYNEHMQDIISDVDGETLEENLLSSGEISVQYYTATNTIKTVSKVPSASSD
uniref:Uncharacterized protein n=1 Tax=Amphimedon queenslandica TaxID=400682 RepID=A0A1X7UTL3_AMPQE